MTHDSSYIPALGIPQLTRYYDASLATIFQERRFRMRLVDALQVQPGEHVLDIGCGTATQSLLTAQNTTAGFVTGIDIDPAMLAVAQTKVAYSGAAIALAEGSAAVLPYAGDTFDCVFSSVMLHHLPTPLKLDMLAEAHRVLTPGGRVVILDFGPVDNGTLASAVSALLGGFEEVGDNLAGRVPDFLVDVGFVNVTVSDAAFGGVLKLYRGEKAR